ncbi:hypothetical protein JHK82_045728 [Glycine max]|uniref:Uncharacterized protein n=2 Tax=Glycine subgen. Soja TaxID=1462606 RepID=A0A0R0FJN7_SOYBN|nr:hypothetical protein JHK86_044060 [Glycine max]KAG4940018.1 hypothetical protein JHK87_043889 [Glycine soja]KAG4950776.1 hypothetical protein JHK85_044643 [Glycine max]KAG5100676.1 hypothetical protein JHK82_045728 [Glycine max]KAG5107258.1 hypothetical protein JHK84_044165 [Glycine max]
MLQIPFIIIKNAIVSPLPNPPHRSDTGTPSSTILRFNPSEDILHKESGSVIEPHAHPRNGDNLVDNGGNPHWDGSNECRQQKRPCSSEIWWCSLGGSYGEPAKASISASQEFLISTTT